MSDSDLLSPDPRTEAPDEKTRYSTSNQSSATTDHPGLSEAEQSQATRIRLPAAQVPADDETASEAMLTGAIGPGTILKSRFIIEQEIARGGMGVVYRARDIRRLQFQDRNPNMAIKVLNEECKTLPESFIALQREAGKAQMLAHPNIVTVHDFDSDGEVVFMTMEYLEGESLERRFSRQGTSRVPPPEAFHIINGIGQGLAYAHHKGIVHCDLKPGNVFLCEDGTVKILDFGIARAVKRPDRAQPDATRFDPGRLGALTPAYASCEMIENATPDPRDDIYALACVAYELLTGHHPYNRLQANQARDSHLKPAPVKGLSRSQWKALQQALAFDREARPDSVDSFTRALSGEQIIERGKRRRTWPVVVLLLLLGIGALYFLTMRPFPASTTAATKTASAARPVQPVVLTAEQQQIVQRLLEAAEIHFMVHRVTSPEGSNAYAAYKHVLEIDPTNPQALAGMKKIANYYAGLARKAMNKNDRKQAQTMIRIGLKVRPNDAGLLTLQQQLQNHSLLQRMAAWVKQW